MARRTDLNAQDDSFTQSSLLDAITEQTGVSVDISALNQPDGKYAIIMTDAAGKTEFLVERLSKKVADAMVYPLYVLTSKAYRNGKNSK